MEVKGSVQALNINAFKRYSPQARVNQSLVASNDLVTRLNCYEPGQVTPFHVHPNDDEVIFCVEGRGAITQRDLVINTLRMRPDRIIVGEVRGPEALDMLQAMNTGHDGSLTTIHSNSPRDAITRIETMIAMSGLDVPQRIARQQIASAIQVILQVSRLSDGTRRLESLMEITGMEGDVISMSEIFRFEREGIGADGRVLGRLVATGIRPQFCEQMRLAGIELPENTFSPKGKRSH